MDKFILFLREESKRQSTIDTYVRDVKKFQEWHEASFGNQMDVTQVSALDVQDYKQYLVNTAKNKTGGRLSPKTVNKRLEALRTYFRFLQETGEVKVNPMAKVKPQKIQNRSESVKWLNRNEKNHLVRIVNDVTAWKNKESNMIRNRAIVYTILHAGLRINEVAQLELADVDLNKQIIYVNDGKGGKFRRVEINKDLLQAFREYLAVRGNGGSKFFLSQKGEMSVDGMKNIFRQLKTKTNIEALSPHMLRHTFCHDLAEKGVSLTLIADLAGHSDLNTTRIYIQSSEEERRNALSKLSSVE